MLLEESKMRAKMKETAKAYKVKASYGGFYAKSGNYFWAIQNVPHSRNSRNVISGIKPWSWDESLEAIVHPGSHSRFTDLSRWMGGAAMRLYYFPQEVYTFRVERRGADILVDDAELGRAAKEILAKEKEKIEELICLAETQYGDFDEYCIANAGYTPSLYCGLLYAGFASVRKKRYAQAIEFLLRAKEDGGPNNGFHAFNLSYGKAGRDLRDVLLDYSKTMLEGSEWTNAKVVGG